MSLSLSRLRQLLPEILILAAAALTRFWRLNYHSIWFDEAVSLRWAGASPFNVDLNYMVPVTFRLVEEKHPPVYYTLLYGWRELMEVLGWGQNDAALRTLGAILGIGTVLGMLLLVRRVSGRRVALWTGGFVALSPVLIWYSQELRMFQPAVMFIVWALYGLIRAWRCEVWVRRILWWLFMVLGFELALYCYLFSAFGLPAAGFTLLVLLGWDRPKSAQGDDLLWPAGLRRFGEGTVALAITGALFLPLARNAWLVNSNESTAGSAFENFWQTTRDLFEIFTLWRENWNGPWDNLALLFLALLFVIGLWGITSLLRASALNGDRANTNADFCTTGLLLVVWIGLPLLLGNLLLAQNSAVFKEDRYHIYLVPFVLWAIAAGVVRLGDYRRWFTWLAGGLIVGLFVLILPRLWSTELLREDWRAAAQYIDGYEQSSPGLPSAAVAHINYTHQPMDWYLRQRYSFDDLPVFGLFGDPLSEDMIDSVVAPPLNGIVEYGAKTLWLTQSHLSGVDDQGIVEGWLRANFPVITEQYPTGVKLTGFALQSHFERLPQYSHSLNDVNVTLGPGIILQSCEIMTTEVYARDARLHPPSGWVHVRLWWRTEGPVENDYSVTAQIANAEGVWGELLEHGNGAFAFYPTSSWPTGTLIRTEVDINLNPLTPTGDYVVQIGLVTDSGSVEVPAQVCGTVSILG